jgi:DNA-binding NtrC family response regulator
MSKILIVDDEPNMLRLFSKILQEEPVELKLVSSGREGLKCIEEQNYDVILSDLHLPDLNGMELLQRSVELDQDIPFIVITGYGTIESAVYAIKHGAYEYVTKPFQREPTLRTIQRALKHAQMTREIRELRKEVGKTYDFQSIITKSKKMKDLFHLIERVADSSSTILISGESGTGKEKFAKAIHYQSVRRNKPFVAVNCSVLPEPLLESELFGHAKGAFTGAIQEKIGLFLEADQGTLFLDELGEISLSMQTKLLRALQEREIKPVGSNKSIKVNPKVVVATNQNLEKNVAEGKFRADLYYRIAVIPIHLPPLRERKEDIPLLSNHFLKKYCQEKPKTSFQNFSTRLTTSHQLLLAR